MTVELGDQASGFRHQKVIEFINREVTLNGGGPDLYAAYSSRSWKEVEDQLLLVLSDPEVPEPIKRANAWSALALSVSLDARQRDLDEYQLQQQISQHVSVSRAMSTELMWLREQRQMSMDEMHTTRGTLNKVLDELDILLRQLCHLESTIPTLAQPLMDTPPLGSALARSRAVLLQAIEQAEKVMGRHQMLPSESQGAVSGSLYYQRGPQSTRAQGLLPPSKSPLGSIDLHDEREGFRSDSQEEYSDPGARKMIKVQISQKIPMKTKMKKSAGYKHQKSRAYKARPLDWQCLSCNMLNFSWRKFCFRCKKSFKTMGKQNDQ